MFSQGGTWMQRCFTCAWLNTHCHHTCHWARCTASTSASCTTLLGKYVRKYDDCSHHDMSYSFLWHVSYSPVSETAWCRCGPVGPLQGSRSSRVTLFFPIYELFWSHHIWYGTFLILQMYHITFQDPSQHHKDHKQVRNSLCTETSVSEKIRETWKKWSDVPILNEVICP